MDALHAQLDEVIEALRDESHQQAECWSTIRTPSALFDFEQGLQAVLNKIHTGIVGAVLEAMHRDRNFVTACQNQSRLQGGVLQRMGGVMYAVRTLGGQHVHLKTPYAKLPKERGQGHLRKQRHQHGTGIYSRFASLRQISDTTPRLLAEVNRHIADGPSGTEAVERFASREIRLTPATHAGSCAGLCEYRSVATPEAEAAHLEQVTVYRTCPFSWEACGGGDSTEDVSACGSIK